jgi:hypothetical protein
MSVKGKTTKRPNDNQGKLVRHTPNPLSRSCFENCCKHLQGHDHGRIVDFYGDVEHVFSVLAAPNHRAILLDTV